MSTSPPASRDAAAPSPVDRALAWWLLVGGLVGALAAAVLLVEKITLLSDPTYVPSCNINPILSCGSIMQTAQAEAFGFPNPLIGVAAFPVVAATGVALLGGARLARSYWVGLQVGVSFGIAFVGWLVYNSIYVIGALCPYCMIVWSVMIPTFVTVTVRNLTSGVLGRAVADSRVSSTLAAWVAPIILAPYVVVVVLIGVAFWDYWSTLL